MKPFLLATTNQHKVKEIAELLPADFKVEKAPHNLEVAETGNSFLENAFLKAKAYYDQFQQAVLADDSGLVVEALPEEMGVYSARFGGEGLNDEARAQLLITKLQKAENRQAHYVCYLCCYLNPQEIFFFEGRVHGSIGHSLRGEDGFGYDPVFIPKDETGNEQFPSMAMIPEWKKENSHRAKAVQAMVEFLRCQCS